MRAWIVVIAVFAASYTAYGRQDAMLTGIVVAVCWMFDSLIAANQYGKQIDRLKERLNQMEGQRDGWRGTAHRIAAKSDKPTPAWVEQMKGDALKLQVLYDETRAENDQLRDLVAMHRAAVKINEETRP